MPKILETVVTTISPQGRVHLAPMGIRHEAGRVLLMPFKPSATLDNVLASGSAVLNLTDDVRVFAGCVTGRRDFPTVALSGGRGHRLANTLSHLPLTLERVQDDAVRPVLYMRPGEQVVDAPFCGFNRAQAAVIEGAVLVSRLGMLDAGKLERELAYLQTAIDKTAGEQELEAWSWLLQAVAAHRARGEDKVGS